MGSGAGSSIGAGASGGGDDGGNQLGCLRRGAGAQLSGKIERLMLGVSKSCVLLRDCERHCISRRMFACGNVMKRGGIVLMIASASIVSMWAPATTAGVMLIDSPKYESSK